MAARNRGRRIRVATVTDHRHCLRGAGNGGGPDRLGAGRRAAHQILASWALQHLAARRASEVTP